jgi:hypothetical protein
MINMSALAVSQLLESAQERGIELTLETAAIENQVNITKRNYAEVLFVSECFCCCFYHLHYINCLNQS